MPLHQSMYCKLFIYGQWRTAGSVICGGQRCVLNPRFSGQRNDLSNLVFFPVASASPYLCGSTYWNGVRRSSAGSSIMSIGTICTAPFWCSSQTQVGHSSCTWDQLRRWEWGIMRWLWAMMCVFCETVEQTALCINKERWLSCGEIYDSHISCAGNIIIQARVTTGEDEAFHARVVLPLRKWIRLDCYIQDTKV